MMYLFVLLLSLLVAGCAGSLTPQKAAFDEIHHQTDRFAQAVRAKNASLVYDLLDPAWSSQFDKNSFSSYFFDNYDIFVEYSSRISEQSQFDELSARMTDDPCAQILLAPDGNGQWQIVHVENNILAPDELRHSLIRALKTQQFLTMLDTCQQQHPEITASDLRHLKRVVAYDDIPDQNVVFSADNAVITIPQTARIQLICSPEGWRLAQCSLLP